MSELEVLQGLSTEERASMLRLLIAEAGKAEVAAINKEIHTTPRVPPRFAPLVSDMENLVLDIAPDVKNDECFAFIIIYDGFQNKASKHVVNLARKRIYVDVNGSEWNGLAQFIWSKGGTLDTIYVSRKASQFNRDTKDGRPVALKAKVAKSK